MTTDPTYEAFFQALCKLIDSDWKGRKGVLAQEANISGGYLSDILNRKRKASFKKQTSLATAIGYEYEDLLSLGRKLLAKETPDSQTRDSTANPTKEVPKKDVKVGKKMEAEALKDLLQHYKEELNALRRDTEYLRTRNRELEERNRELETTKRETDVKASEPAKPEKKTAV